MLVGVIATLAATALGTAIAIALVRYTFRFRTIVTLLLFLPMATPEVVLGSGLGSQLVGLGVERGLWTIIIAHIMFCISFVVVTVRARVAGLDPALEEAGRDLYASPAQVFWRVTFPLLIPASSPRPCCASPSASTTSSSPTSPRATPRPSRSSSTSRQRAGSRPRRT